MPMRSCFFFSQKTILFHGISAPSRPKCQQLAPVKQHCRCHTEALQSLGFTATFSGTFLHASSPWFSLGWASGHRADFNPPWKIQTKSIGSLLVLHVLLLRKLSQKFPLSASDLHHFSFRYHFNPLISMRQASMNEIRGDNGPFLLRWCSPQRSHQQAPQEKLTHRLRQNWAPKPGIKTGLPVEMAHKIPTKFDGFFLKVLLEFQIDVKINTTR